VHTPIQEAEDVEAFRSKVNQSSPQNPVYGTAVKSLDESVGRLLQYVKERPGR